MGGAGWWLMVTYLLIGWRHYDVIGWRHRVSRGVIKCKVVQEPHKDYTYDRPPCSLPHRRPHISESLFIKTSMDDRDEEKKTEQNLFVCSDKSEVDVTNNRWLRYWSRYWQIRSIARPLCDSRATCTIYAHYHSGHYSGLGGVCALWVVLLVCVTPMGNFFSVCSARESCSESILRHHGTPRIRLSLDWGWVKRCKNGDPYLGNERKYLHN